MGNRQDRTAEIIEFKQRNVRTVPWFELSMLKRQKAESRQTLDIYVIRTVTILEVFTRHEITELIDHGQPYTDRAIDLAKNVKMDFALVRDVQGRTITLGDIVAHNLPVSSIENIFSHFDTLLGGKLRGSVTAAYDRWDVEIEKKPRVPLVKDWDAMARTLSRLFAARHILCHELPEHRPYEASDVDDFIEQATQFMTGLKEALLLEKHGMYPLTQAEMNQEAGDRLKAKEADLERLVADIRLSIGSDTGWVQAFDEAQAHWRAYRDRFADVWTHPYQEGTIRPCLWAGQALQHTETRIKELQGWAAFDEVGKR